mgnify:CR=1 FL=1
MWTLVACDTPAPAQGDPPLLDIRYVRFSLNVAPSPIAGWGVFAAERIPPRRKVIEYAGERIDSEEASRRLNRKIHKIFAVDSEWSIDAAACGSGAELINHSCDPNLRTAILRGHILYMAKRLIEPGEELTVDYKFRPNDMGVVCFCRSPKCRGTINVRA